MESIFTESNLKEIIIFYILFHFTILFIEDRIRYVPQVVTKWEERAGDETFVNFIKSLWRTALSASLSLMIFWLYNFFKFGFLVFGLETTGIFRKEKVILITVLNSLIPIYFFILIKFIFILFLGKNFVSDALLFFTPRSSILRYFFASLDFFRLLEYALLYTGIRKNIKVNPIILVFLLIPLFFGENLINFTYQKGG